MTTVFFLGWPGVAPAQSDEALILALKKAGERAGFFATGSLKSEIEEITRNIHPYGLFRSKKFFAQRAIVAQLRAENRLALLRYRTWWLREVGLDMDEIDSNFSQRILRDVGEIHKALLLMIQTMDDARQWLPVAWETNRTLRTLDRISRKTYQAWVPYSGAPDPRDLNLVLLGVGIPTGHTPVHELVPDAEMGRAVRKAFEGTAIAVLAALDQQGHHLGVSSASKLAAAITRPKIRLLHNSGDEQTHCERPLIEDASKK